MWSKRKRENNCTYIQWLLHFHVGSWTQVGYDSVVSNSSWRRGNLHVGDLFNQSCNILSIACK